MPEETFTFAVKGLAEIEAALVKLPDEIAERELTRAVMAGAEPIRDFAARMAPIRAGFGAKTIGSKKNAKQARLPGFLRAHIMRKRIDQGNRGRVTVGIGPSRKAFYGMFVELGTRFVPARPFLRPALEQKQHEAIERMRAVLVPAIERSTRRLLGFRARGRL